MSRRDDAPWPAGELEDEDVDEMFARREGRYRHAVPDFVRRAIENTMGSVHNTQTASREALQFFLSSTDKTKREIVRIVASEVGTFLRHVDISSEVIKVLTSVQADVNVSVRFRRTEDGGLEPEVAAGRASKGEAVAEGAQTAPAPREERADRGDRAARGERSEREGRSDSTRGERSEREGRSDSTRGERSEREGRSDSTRGERSEREGRSDSTRGGRGDREGRSDSTRGGSRGSGGP